MMVAVPTGTRQRVARRSSGASRTTFVTAIDDMSSTGDAQSNGRLPSRGLDRAATTSPGDQTRALAYWRKSSTRLVAKATASTDGISCRIDGDAGSRSSAHADRSGLVIIRIIEVTSTRWVGLNRILNSCSIPNTVCQA